MSTSTAPQYDPELTALLIASGDPRESFTMDSLERRRTEWVAAPIEEMLAGRTVVHDEREIVGYGGSLISISVLRSTSATASGPGFLHVHSGGMMIGNRFVDIEQVLNWVERFEGVCVSVEYRLAPEHPDPVPLEDSYAALEFMAEHAEELGIDPSLMFVAGMSAGGGIAAGLALLARDRGGPVLAGQLLMCPMLDERNSSESSRQYSGLGLWDRESNDTGWNALLGERRHTDAVSIYASPSLATDLTRLPPTFIDVGSMEVFRDEDMEYARRIAAAGSPVELHIWPGAFHGFDLAFPQAAISRRALAARQEWLQRVLQQAQSEEYPS
jgi:acetyl esterase/lipase